MKDSHIKNIPHNVTEIILESVSDGVFTVDKKWCITSFNRAAEEITGVSREEAIGKQCCEVFRSNMCEMNCALRRTMKSGIPYVDSSTYIVNFEKRRIPVTVCTSLLKDVKGIIIGGVETFRDMSMVEELRRELDERYQVGDIISRSKSMRKIIKILPKIANNDSTILIQGETGTGKELIAQAIHGLSPRKEKPFMAINCGALPDTLLESELFGYKAGAFTDAKKDKPGLLALAEGGTIFLDEIGDVSSAFQVRLLRVLQERTFTPLGGTKPVKIDIRVVAASNKNIDQLVKDGTFRQDLFYRINVMQLEIPPLRDRKEDIPSLVTYFINKFNKLQRKVVSGISHEVLESLMSYEYPGNVRELENIIEHAFILCPKGQIELHCLPDIVSQSSDLETSQSIDDVKKSVEAKLIISALKRHNYNRLEAARDLGMHKSTLFRKIKTLGIDLPKTDGRSKQKDFS
ncbi:sigma 54-interacting transcriptional regulator [candidate division KSB1 bacterium]|nr:sigma 54-interacting transcriptional regulator [candidate division KSB1 bacterium]